jgi:hypothetical protein
VLRRRDQLGAIHKGLTSEPKLSQFLTDFSSLHAA